MSQDLISEWKSEIADTVLQSKSGCLAIYSVDGTLLFCNDAFSALLSDNSVASFINPTFEKIIAMESDTGLVFSGYVTIGSNHTVNTSIFAHIYRKNDTLMIAGGVDIITLLEQNKAVMRMNGEINKLQREIISKNKQLQKTNKELDEANDELLQLNEVIGAINETLKENLQEINTLNNHLAVKNEKLYELNATKDKFFSIIAHDLKNPFSAILGFSDLLLENIHNYNRNKILDFLKIIRSASKNAYHLLENLLVWSRSQSGKIEFNPTINDLSEIIKENIELIESQSAKKGIQVSADINDGPAVCYDVNMINTVMRNLLTNALKFTNQNGRVTVSAKQTGSEYEITVSDTGVGISPENLQKLFKIDSKFQRQGTDAEKGTGLGLILCKEFVEKHGGHIWVESQIGKGSDFKFTLPLYSGN